MLVKKRLAQGKSYSEAIEGTVIKSKTTAGNIARENLDEIGRLRERYIQLIEEFGAGELERARLWAEMAGAIKIYRSKDNFVEIPDWTNRREALKYIDSLAGIAVGKKQPGQQLNPWNFFNIPPEKLRWYQDRALEAVLERK